MMRSSSKANTNEEICRLWTLRRWNSFAPRVPVGYRGPGGGYLLQWNNRNLVIDPGFDFLENLYRIPMTVGDIDAILITHGHIDHYADMNIILMMKRERNERLQAQTKEKEDPLRLILSSDMFVQLMPLLRSQDSGVVNVDEVVVLTPDAHIDLRRDMDLTIETFKTEHIPYAVGIVFHLVDPNDCDKELLSVGMTSDSPYEPESDLSRRLSNCEAVVAHLGTVSIKRLLGFAQLRGGKKVAEVFKTLESAGPPVLKREDAKMISQNILEAESTLGVNCIIEELINLYEGAESYYAGCTRSHLEFGGILHLFEELFQDRTKARVGVISEFGEELGSFRHKTSDAINQAILSGERGREKQRVMTGDIGLCLHIAPAGEVCERFQSNGECPGSIARKCAKSVSHLVVCTKCHKAVPLRCIDELCIRHRREGIYYNCPRCVDRETSPPSGPLIAL